MTGGRTGDTASSGPSLAGLPADADGRDAVAGEFVLGTLDSYTAQRVAAAMQMEPDWHAAVATWQVRLLPLTQLARPETPPPNLWDRIETRIAPHDTPRARGARRGNAIWRACAILATLGLVALAAWVLVPRSVPPRLMSVMVNDRNLPGVLVEAGNGNDLHLTILPAATGRQLQAPAGRVLQMWLVLPGGQRPVSVGLLPHEPGRQVVLPSPRARAVPDALVEISIEPEGGSPSGTPGGAVVFIGRLGYASVENQIASTPPAP
jgi:anti-sigma-K factor RskA